MLKRWNHLLLICASLLLAAGATAQDTPEAPRAKRVEWKEVRHGETVIDPWYWLREKANPEVAAYLEAENAYTEAKTKGQEAFRETLYQEMLGRIQQTDQSVPVRDGRFVYYARTIEGLQYPIRCRKPAKLKEGEEAAETVLLDLNEMARGLKYIGVGEYEVSDDDKLLAYSVDTVGFRQYSLFVKSIEDGKSLDFKAERVTSAAWAADHRTLFYVTEDPVTKRSNQLWRQVIGGKAELVYEENDELFSIGVGKTRDKKYILFTARSTDTYETWFLEASKPEAAFTSVLGRSKGHKYGVDHRSGLFYARTNKDAKNFRVVTFPVDKRDTWTSFVDHDPNVLVSGVDVFEGHAVVREQAAALPRFRVLDFKSNSWRTISFPDEVYAAFSGGTPSFDADAYRISYQSMVTPPSVYDFDLKTLDPTLLKREEVLGGYDPVNYVTNRLWIAARDGTKVPVSVVRRKDVAANGKAPLWLYAYGSYGAGMPATFSSTRVSLLDRGVIYAIAHIRGGNEMGEEWHDDGMLMKKKNTFTDFIDVAEGLIAAKWTAKDRLLIEGGSAGGLLMGAVVNMRPDLFAGVHAAVPFVDVMNTMLDASLPLTVGEYLEWGNPNEKAAYDYMVSYSPYDNLEAKDYPPILVTTSFHDSQVMYWEPAKYVARLRATKTDANELLLKCKMEPSGHGGASGRYDRLRDLAFIYAWMLNRIPATD